MGNLVVYQFRGRGSNMCSLGIDYHRDCLYCGDIELDGSYVDLISIWLASIGIFIGACSYHVAKVPTVQASSFWDPLLAFLRC
jgi:hypothetical protein